jgi:hypothetical protein
MINNFISCNSLNQLQLIKPPGGLIIKNILKHSKTSYKINIHQIQKIRNSENKEFDKLISLINTIIFSFIVLFLFFLVSWKL